MIGDFDPGGRQSPLIEPPAGVSERGGNGIGVFSALDKARKHKNINSLPELRRWSRNLDPVIDWGFQFCEILESREFSGVESEVGHHKFTFGGVGCLVRGF